MRIQVHGDTVAALTVAAVLADTGNRVTLLLPDDLSEALLRQRARSEPGLIPLLERVEAAGRLQVTQRDSNPAAEVFIFAMSAERQGWAEALCDEIAVAGSAPCLLVNRATFPIGTSEALQRRIAAQRPCTLVVEPDFISEGRAIESYTRPARILLGCEDEEGVELMRELYRPFNRNRDVIQVVTPRAAELTKFATNAMLATRISFINEIAQLAEACGVDVEQVRQGLGMDRRIGFDFLYPGVGFGGPNFARDVLRLARTMAEQGVDSTLLDAVLAINEQQKEALFRKAWRHFDRNLQGRRFALWGLSYKPNTASVINAPSVPLARALLAQDARLAVHDPAAADAFLAALTEQERTGVAVADSPELAASGSDGIMLVTEWKAYWQPDWRALREDMRTPVVFDGRNIYTPERVRAAGFAYHGIGR